MAEEKMSNNEPNNEQERNTPEQEQKSTLGSMLGNVTNSDDVFDVVSFLDSPASKKLKKTADKNSQAAPESTFVQNTKGEILSQNKPLEQKPSLPKAEEAPVPPINIQPAEQPTPKQNLHLAKTEIPSSAAVSNEPVFEIKQIQAQAKADSTALPAANADKQINMSKPAENNAKESISNETPNEKPLEQAKAKDTEPAPAAELKAAVLKNAKQDSSINLAPQVENQNLVSQAASHTEVKNTKKSTRKVGSSKKKSLVFGILAFLLTGGVIFIFMIMQGNSGLKKDDANINFSYGNVIREAVSPLFEALGLTEKKDDLTGIKSRLAAREERPLDISDWLGSSGGQAASSSGSSSSSGHSGWHNSGGASSQSGPYGKMDSMSDYGFGSGGSTSSSGDGKGMSSYKSGSSSDKINQNAVQAKRGQTPASSKGFEALKATRKMLSHGLMSGSANVARNEWSSAFGEGQSYGKTYGFSNNNKAKEVIYKDAGLASLDQIKSGEISNLKMDTEGKANLDVSMPKMDEDKDSKNEESALDKMINAAIGDIKLSSGTAGAGSFEKALANAQAETVPDELRQIAETPRPNGPYAPKKTEKEPAVYSDGTPVVPPYEHYFKDDKPQYTKTPQGNWVVTYSGVEVRIYEENGKKREEKVKYSDVCLLYPDGKKNYYPIYSEETGKDGKTTHWWEPGTGMEE